MKVKHALISAMTLLPHAASSHPIDEIVQATYISFGKNEISVELDLTPGAGVAPEIVDDIDANHNRRIEKSEIRSFAMRVLENCVLRVDDSALLLILTDSNLPTYQTLWAGLDEIKIYAIVSNPLTEGTHWLDYENRYEPAPSRRNANVILRSAELGQFQVNQQWHDVGGRQLLVRYEVLSDQ